MNKLRDALQIASVALNDWVVSHASDMAGPTAIKKTSERIGKFGHLAYIASVQETIKQALTSLPDEDKIIEEVARAMWKARQEWTKVNYQNEAACPNLEDYDTPWGETNIAEANGTLEEAKAAISCYKKLVE